MHGVAAADRGADRSLDRPDFGRCPAATPVADVDHLVLPESQGRLASVEGERDKPVPLAPVAGLVLDPVGIDRVPGPKYDHDVSGLERFGDRSGISGATLDQGIPPDGVAGLLKGRGKALGASLVLPRIAKEERDWLRGCTRLIRHDAPSWSVAHLVPPLSSQTRISERRVSARADRRTEGEAEAGGRGAAAALGRRPRNARRNKGSRGSRVRRRNENRARPGDPSAICRCGRSNRAGWSCRQPPGSAWREPAGAGAPAGSAPAVRPDPDG